MKYQSNAAWSKIKNTSDQHDTKEQAQAVCDILERDYNKMHPCEFRGVCLCAYVSAIEEDN